MFNPAFFWAGIAAAGVSLFGMVTAVAVIPNTDPIGQKTIVEQLSITPTAEILPEDATFFREERIQRGDTLASVMSRLGINDEEALNFVREAPNSRAALRRLVTGQTVYASTTAFGKLLSLELPGSSNDRIMLLERRSNGFKLGETTLAYDVRTQTKAAEIRSSLFGATDDAGLPDSVATGLAEIFDSEIDFHRDLRKGDRFHVVYEVMMNRGLPIKTGRILAAEFINGGRRHTAIWNEYSRGKGAYYTAEGKSLKRGFLRSPLEFSRVTSGMGMRFHPILGSWKQHNGVDYGAPTGTRVRATADGTVEFAGRQNGYGNIVVLQHSGGIETAYAHLSRIDVRAGQHIQQNDSLGAVGATGAATGPHLHYEFRVAGVHKDPLTVSLPEALPLMGSQLAAFQQRSAALLAELNSVPISQIARAE
ncbi:MAG: M23 family metallopeptidase [Betaproteobacteria bacterium]|nr:M23 family metallopeptidase [Betaproteobacteria bacterium]